MLNRTSYQGRLSQQFHTSNASDAQALKISLPLSFCGNPDNRVKLELV